MPIPNRYYEAVRGWAPACWTSIAGSNRFFPVTDKSARSTGTADSPPRPAMPLYTARAYPRQYWNRHGVRRRADRAPGRHLHARIARGATSSPITAGTSSPATTSGPRPIAAEVGPDGHVWVIDWYNYIVQHNPTPHGFKTGTGNAYETPLRDKTHGRIYRIVYKDAPASRPPVLHTDDPQGLVAALGNDNQFWRMHAQRLLVERGKTDVVPALIERSRDRSVDAIGLNAGAIHAALDASGPGVLDGSNADATGAATAALKHPSAGVRRNALQVLPRNPQSAAAVSASGLLTDPDPQVRLAALLCLADQPASDEAAKRAGRRPSWRTHGDTTDGSPTRRPPPRAATTSHSSRRWPRPAAGRSAGRPAGSSTRVAEHWARGGPADQAGGLLASLRGGAATVNEALLRGMAKGWPKGRPAKLDQRPPRPSSSSPWSCPRRARGQLIRLASPWGDTVLASINAEMAASLLATAKDESIPERRRIDAAKQLVELQGSSGELAQQLLALITPRTPPDLAAGLIGAVAEGSAPEAGKAMVERLPALAPALRAEVIRALLRRADWTPALMDALEQTQLRVSELALDQKQALAAHPNTAIARARRRLLQAAAVSPTPTARR